MKSSVICASSPRTAPKSYALEHSWRSTIIVLSLRRTSKRLRVVAESFLYGEAVTSDVDGARFAHRISRLLLTTMERPALAAKIQSVEHDLAECGYKFKKSDAVCRSFYDSTEWNEHSTRMHTAAEKTWTGDILKVWKRQLRRNPELAQLALLLRLCPNITNSHTQMFHEGATAFLTLLASNIKTDAIQHRSQSAFGKLEKVSIQSVLMTWDLLLASASWDICRLNRDPSTSSPESYQSVVSSSRRIGAVLVLHSEHNCHWARSEKSRS